MTLVLFVLFAIPIMVVGYLVGLGLDLLLGRERTAFLMVVLVLFGLVVASPIPAVLSFGYVVGDVLMCRIGGYSR